MNIRNSTMGGEVDGALNPIATTIEDKKSSGGGEE